MDELILNNQMLSEENVELKQEEAELQVINKKQHELTQENQQLQEKLETTQAEDNQTIVKERQNSDLQDKLGEERPEFDIPENEYEEFPEDMMLTLELTKDNACNDDDIIEMLNGLEEKIRADVQRSLNDQFYILKGGVSRLDNESCVPLKEKTTLRRSLSFDEGYNSDKENYGNNLPSSIGSDISTEKVAKSRNV